MKFIKNFNHSQNLYSFFIFLALNIFFFSTTFFKVKAFEINNVEISKPFEINFNKNKVIDEGFREAFFQLISLTVDSNDKKKISQIQLNEIKAMIESFSIKEEKFVNEIYHVNLGVSFNKKNFFNYLEKKNIFPTIPNKKKFLFIPIIIDENKKDLLFFYNNKIFDEWNNINQKHHLIEYILPTEDIEDLEIIKKKFEVIEQYDFKDITEKYDLNNSIIALIFKNDKEMRVLSRVTIKDKVNLKNQSFLDIDINNKENISLVIYKLKTIYEDFWKKSNQINTSIKLPLTLKIRSYDNLMISKFEKVLSKIDLIYEYSILKFDKDFIFYQIIFNGTHNSFLNSMKDNGFSFETQNKVWALK
jgi:hypothetical protein